MRTAILDGKDGAANVEQGDVDTVELDEFTTARKQFINGADLKPVGGHTVMKRETMNDA